MTLWINPVIKDMIKNYFDMIKNFFDTFIFLFI